MIKGLSGKVDIIFTEDASAFLLIIPYCQTSKEFLSCYSMTGIKREWMPGFKAYRFNSKDFYDVVELLPDFFKGDEDDYSLSDCRPAGSLADIRTGRKRQTERYVP